MASTSIYIDQARAWAAGLVRQESRGRGDYENAMRRVARACGVSYSTIWALHYRAPKTLDVGVYHALRDAYEAMCERQMRRLNDELERTRAMAGADSRAVRAALALVRQGENPARRSWWQVLLTLARSRSNQRG